MITSTVGPLTFSQIEPEAGLKAALAMPRADIIAEINKSSVKGRGGAGFPLGMKWNFAAAEQSAEKFVICNADEGEPGTFKDRVILTEFPDLVFEGMTIAGRAIGAKNGIVYLRAEYTYLRRQLEDTLAKRREQGLLGKNVLGRDGFDFDIRIQMGAGAYVCGEETALIESLEGFRGEPRNRPPFPVNTGYLGRPSTVNNVETLADAACILAKGADWFKSKGTEKSTGTKIFSVSGDCEKPGVYEFPLGIGIAELLAEVGGAGAKAVQVGGASGICVPAGQFSRKIAFEDVPTGGSIIVFGPGRDMLQVAHNFLDFFVDESCGQCTPCRGGNAKMLEGAEKLREGTLTLAALDELKELAETMRIASKCGLGQTSSNAFMSIIESFGDEIMARALIQPEPARN
jgi:[NiFe] hydrogenase diaphorase moiety large subunit